MSHCSDFYITSLLIVIGFFEKLHTALVSGVTTRGEVRQLPQGAKRQGGALGADGLFALLLNF